MGSDASLHDTIPAPVIRCVTCRRLFAGTDVVTGYRNHQCQPVAALFDPPHPYSMVGVRK